MKPTTFLIFSLFLLCTACKKPINRHSESPAIEQSKLDYKKFENYITNYSQSPVSRCNDLFFHLGFQLPQGYKLPSNLVEISPAVGGTVTLDRYRRRIELKNADIKHNVKYTVNFHIGLLTEMPADMQTFSFPMEAEMQSWDISLDAPISKSMEEVSYSGKVIYGVCEPQREIIEESLKAMQGDKALDIRWTHERNKKESSFTIKNIERKDSPGYVDLNLSMQSVNVDDQANLKLAIPSTSDFSFYSHSIENNKHITINFTDPLLSSQNIEGLIDVENRKINQTKINGNKVDVFFDGEDYGNFNLRILPGIKNQAGFPLKDRYEKELFFRPADPMVKIAEKGNILPPSKKWELPISATSVSGFRLRILKVYDHNISRFYQENAKPYNQQRGLENLGRLTLDTIIKLDKDKPFLESYHSIALDRQIKNEPGALYKVFISIPEEHNVFPCNEIKGNPTYDVIDRIDFDHPWSRLRYNYEYYEEDYYQGSYYDNNLGSTYYRENYDQRYNNDPCTRRYTSAIMDARLLMCTDIGVVAKYEPEKKNFFFYSSEISTARPLANSHIEVYNIQGKKIGSSYTDGNGMADIAVKQNKAFLAKVTNKNQTTYLGLQDAKALSLSTFQVEGKNWNGSEKVFFYGERDVWRPGDTIHMNAIVFSPEKPLPDGLPIQLKLHDPRGKLVEEWKVNNSSKGIYDCHFSTDQDDPTGYWKLSLKLGGKLYKTTVRVETIRPNRLKIKMAFANDKMLREQDSKVAPLEVKWMHGLVAKGLKTEIVMLQKGMTNPFGANYQNYIFNDLSKRYVADLGMVKTGTTDVSGKLDFMIPTENPSTYPSMMQFNFDLRSFEKGGAFSTDVKAVRYSPYTHYVGIKFPGGNTADHIYVKDDEAIMIASVDEEGNAQSREIQVKISYIDHNWWYQFGNQGNYSALKNSIKESKEEYTLTVGKEGKSIKLNTYGRVLIELEDIKSGHSVSRLVYSYGDRWIDENAEVSQLEVLPLLIEQTDYEVNDLLSFNLPSISGQYLITIENGGKIVHKETMRGTSSPQKVQIAITPDMAPTAYLHVHLMQPWETHINDRPLRLFGIKPLKVYDGNTIIHPKIEMADELTTDKPFTVNISEENGKAMSYTLAIVDEGLLDITQFKTPDPWSVFYGKESLNVKTWDMYRDIFRRFLGEYTSLLAVGGDGSNLIEPNSRARRFKPVVKHIGPIILEAGETKSHEFNISNYVGSVRAMVVSTNGRALGKSDKTVAVTKPLMLYATLPRVLGPDEKLKLPITVFSMKEDIKNVTASIKTSTNVTVVGPMTKQISFDKIGEKELFFDIKTKDALGIAKAEIKVSAGAYSYTEFIELDIRPSSPRTTISTQDVISAGKDKKLKFDLIGMPGTNRASVSVSKGLNFSFRPQVEWLSRYPHGCLEQTVSRSFPQLYLFKMNLLDSLDQLKYRQQYKAVIQKLRFLQMPNGGFSYWPGGNVVNDWGSSYALEFLLEAKKYGYNVPEGLIKKAIDYQYKSSEGINILSRNNSRNGSNYLTINYAYKLYTLAKAGKPNYAAMNRLRLQPTLHNTAKWLLAHSFTVLGETDLAKLMIESATQTVEDYQELGGNFGSGLRDQAIIARVLLDMGDKLKAKEVIDEMIATFKADQLSSLNTQERAQSLITFAQFVSSLENLEEDLIYDISLSPSENLGDIILDENPDHYELSEEALKTKQVNIKNEGDSELYTSITVSGQALKDDSKASEKNLQLEISYFDEDGVSIKPSKLKKGKDFTIQYRVKHTGILASYENLALTAIFPSGWELINQRLNELSTFDSGDDPEYKDVRDDRVLLYFDLDKNKQKTFRFKINASYEGTYWAPPAYCEAMYSSSIYAKSQGFTAIVE